MSVNRTIQKTWNYHSSLPVYSHMGQCYEGGADHIMALDNDQGFFHLCWFTDYRSFFFSFLFKTTSLRIKLTLCLNLQHCINSINLSSSRLTQRKRLYQPLLHNTWYHQPPFYFLAWVIYWLGRLCVPVCVLRIQT